MSALRIALALAAPASVLACLSASMGPAFAFSWETTKEQQALQLARQFQSLHHVPSLSLSVAVSGKTVLAKGLSKGGAIVPGGEEIRYRIGSVTKQITAAAILALIEDSAVVPSTGLPLTLNTTLSDIFPSVDRQSEGGQISVHRLLTMTSNLPSHTSDPVWFNADRTGIPPAFRALDTAEIVDRLRTYKPVGHPFEYQYSNTNYFALSLIIHVLNGGGRQLTDAPAQNFIRQRLFTKAGMVSSEFIEEPRSPKATYARPNFLSLPSFNKGDWARGAGDVISNAIDLARWNIAFISRKVINDASVQMALTPQVLVTGSERYYRGCMYAMGWNVCDGQNYRLYQHDGVISGFMASNAIGRQSDGSWVSATVLGNTDATSEIVSLVRNIIQLAN